MTGLGPKAHTGSYGSQGENSVGLPQDHLDLKAALQYIESDNGLNKLPVMLYGNSWGGYAVTAVLNDGFAISAVASLSGFNSPLGLFSEQAQRMWGPLAWVEYPFESAYQSLRFGSSAGLTAVAGINSTATPVLVIHGSQDQAISYDGASIIAQRDRIANPNVEYTTRNVEGQNNHDRLAKSLSAIVYIDQLN